ncbi:hypothetical protein B0T13DRAFT_475816 [Neurospora crassa]|nr:hypothetical protein B0T13DRAFT_475816 [Neurospora crassa]
MAGGGPPSELPHAPVPPLAVTTILGVVFWCLELLSRALLTPPWEREVVPLRPQSSMTVTHCKHFPACPLPTSVGLALFFALVCLLPLLPLLPSPCPCGLHTPWQCTGVHGIPSSPESHPQLPLPLRIVIPSKARPRTGPFPYLTFSHFPSKRYPDRRFYSQWHTALLSSSLPLFLPYNLA